MNNQCYIEDQEHATSLAGILAAQKRLTTMELVHIEVSESSATFFTPFPSDKLVIIRSKEVLQRF